MRSFIGDGIETALVFTMLVIVYRKVSGKDIREGIIAQTSFVG